MDGMEALRTNEAGARAEFRATFDRWELRRGDHIIAELVTPKGEDPDFEPPPGVICTGEESWWVRHDDRLPWVFACNVGAG
jgi:hypothetical protein